MFVSSLEQGVKILKEMVQAEEVCLVRLEEKG